MTTDNTKRAKALADRIEAIGISGRELASKSGISRGAIDNAVHGRGGRGTYERLENYLTILEEECESERAEPTEVVLDQAAEADVEVEWPDDVAAFLDIVGLYLIQFDKPTRAKAIRAVNRQIIFSARPRHDLD